jgi:hypothetical protein
MNNTTIQGRSPISPVASGAGQWAQRGHDKPLERDGRGRKVHLPQRHGCRHLQQRRLAVLITGVLLGQAAEGLEEALHGSGGLEFNDHADGAVAAVAPRMRLTWRDFAGVTGSQPQGIPAGVVPRITREHLAQLASGLGR